MRDVAWAAGLFEGEGSVGMTGRNKAPQPRMSIGMSDKDVLDEFARIVGIGKVYGPYRGQGRKTPEHYKPMYMWRPGRITEIQQVLRAFWPYLGERRRAEASGMIADYYSTPRMPQRARASY
jgi:hypothetical protein